MLDQVFVGNLAELARRDADDDRPRRDVARDHRAGADESLLADLHAGAEDDAAADPACPPQASVPSSARPPRWRAIESSLVVITPGPMNTSSSITV